MDSLIDEAWRIYDATADTCVVRPSIPILFFGDSAHYACSPLKVVTVALNPSRKEFRTPIGSCGSGARRAFGQGRWTFGLATPTSPR